MPIRWTPTALRDLRSLHTYIALDNIGAASAVADHVLDGVAALARHPEMGRKGRITGTRELVIAPYVVVYRVRRMEIEVAAIIHGARKWPDSL